MSSIKQLLINMSLKWKCIKNYFQTGAVHTDFYKDSDLTLGSVLNVWGRKMIICDSDDFTKEYYRTKYGIGEWGHLVDIFPFLYLYIKSTNRCLKVDL